MRLLTDVLIGLMLTAILAGVVMHYRQERRAHRDLQMVHQALASLREQTLYQGALGQVELSRDGHPLEILPEWFGAERPSNTLISIEQPWLDQADPGDPADHPPDPVVRDPGQAGFWYNPNSGVFRARVPAALTDGQTLRLYNQINGTVLSTLPWQTPDGDEGEDEALPPVGLMDTQPRPPLPSQGSPKQDQVPKPRPSLITAAPKGQSPR